MKNLDPETRAKLMIAALGTLTALFTLLTAIVPH